MSSLATKYRPRTFDDIVGQRATTDTLKKSIVNGTPPKVLMLEGHFGSGKTTLARVFASALNCSASATNGGEPCGTCASCARVFAGHQTMDVTEMDAASNRGVDDARALRQAAQYAPSGDGLHKVYVIDEAHMMTKEAWNSWLKMLEEPPANTVFIFATTESDKIKSTCPAVMSRMMHFKINKVSSADIEARLVSVAAQEGIAVEPAALKELAKRHASPRDALMGLEQLVAGQDLTLQGLQKHQQGHSDAILVGVAGVLYSGDDTRVPKMMDALYAQGAPDMAALFQGIGTVHSDVIEMQQSGAIRSRKVEDAYQRQIFKLANEHPKPVVLAAAQLWQQAEPIMAETSMPAMAANTYIGVTLSASAQIKASLPPRVTPVAAPTAAAPSGSATPDQRRSSPVAP